ncbi:DNA-binding protein [Paenibacillus psychroresistens]|uniref:DNA-binding protein n=1 Tax=Paenibacillus psychroresistens TaxID=1778678 RepID=A0A6B8RNN4_9BACL|nr:helix-turn-helix domain-containing protein [Paenibacillus psychroresistens]QGQ97940.1 DNA-binding protein [Paenibacillus psychroresistens]
MTNTVDKEKKESFHDPIVLGITLDVTDLQRILRVSRAQIYALLQRKEFHSVRVGKNYKISKDVFFKWFQGKGEGIL